MMLRCLVLIYFISTAFCAAQKSNSAVTNQRLFDTVGFMVDHYAKRVALFETQPIPTNAIVFLGNSITEGGNWKKLTGDTTAVNRGIGGDITFGVLKRLEGIIEARPRKLFVLIGINDIAKDIPDAVIADNIRKIIQRVKSGSPETKIYIQSILPVNPLVKNFPQHYDKADHVKKSNVLIRKVAHEETVEFIDIHQLFSDKNGMLKPVFTNDGLHLKPEAYQLWVHHLKAIKAL